MKEVQFRIIELPTHQVLMMKDFDNEQEHESLIVFTVIVDGVKISASLGFNTDEKRDKAFNEMDSETYAKDLLAAALELT